MLFERVAKRYLYLYCHDCAEMYDCEENEHLEEGDVCPNCKDLWPGEEPSILVEREYKP